MGNGMSGKIVFITGATSGIGKSTAIGLAKMGAKIVFTYRNRKKGEDTRKEIIEKTKNSDIHSIYCDLASFYSIRKCCNEFIENYGRLDVLINNAGLWNMNERKSSDGIEETFAVNFLAPFFMTELLLDTLKKSSPSRIINVSSALHRGKINFGDIEMKNEYNGMKAYAQSKLAVILFTRLLAKKLEKDGITVNCLHPGVIATNIIRDRGKAIRFLSRLLFKSPKNGARTSIYLASAPEIENTTGEYFSNKKIVKSSDESKDMETAKKLWKLAEEHIKINDKN